AASPFAPRCCLQTAAANARLARRHADHAPRKNLSILLVNNDPKNGVRNPTPCAFATSLRGERSSLNQSQWRVVVQFPSRSRPRWWLASHPNFGKCPIWVKVLEDWETAQHVTATEKMWRVSNEDRSRAARNCFN